MPSEVIRAFDTLSSHFLQDIWDKMGLDGDGLKARKATTHTILTNTMTDMKAEEEATLDRIINRIEALAKERARLEKELGIALSEVDYDLRLVELEKQLRHDVQSLEERKEEQMREVISLFFNFANLVHFKAKLAFYLITYLIRNNFGLLKVAL